MTHIFNHKRWCRSSPGLFYTSNFYITKLGGSSAFIGKVGDDCFGEIFVGDLEKNGVVTHVSISKEENTGLVFVLILSNGERFFIDDRGANTSLKYKDFNLSLLKNSIFLPLSPAATDIFSRNYRIVPLILFIYISQKIIAISPW